MARPMQHQTCRAARQRRHLLLDVVYLLIVIAFFGAAIAYAHACDHL